jgi:hypothetical protein
LEGNKKLGLKEKRWPDLDWIHVGQVREKLLELAATVMKHWVPQNV